VSFSARVAAFLATAGLLASVAGLEGRADARTAVPAQPRAAAPATFTRAWSQTVTDGVDISTASPVIVQNGSRPFVAVGDLGGNVRAYDLTTGDLVPGWANVNVGYEVKSPLSTDGNNLYVPVAQDYKDNRPQFRKYNAAGTELWRTNNVATQPPGVGFLLAGMSLMQVNGKWRAIGASSGHWIYGFDGATGAEQWSFRNADSTMGTPALADVLGIGVPQVITSNDKTAEFPPKDKNGGHIRIFTAEGRQICSADQPVEGSVHAYSGYNNSSPIVAEINGSPLIVFGSTGPVQYGAGGNQVVAYDAGCGRRWASPPLAAQVQVSPTFADVLGRGTPQVIEAVGIQDGNHQYPRVYVIDPTNGSILVDSGTSLRRYGGQLTYPPGISIATADVNQDGRQDLFVPGSDLLVLDGRSMALLTTVPLQGAAIQNTPVITGLAPSGLRVTYSGYSGNSGPLRHGSLIRSFVSSTGTLGNLGWSRFGNNSQLTGLQGQLHGPYSQIIEGGGVLPGRSLRAGGNTVTMQTDGNLVVRRSDRKVVWTSRTKVRGSRLFLDKFGRLQIIAPNGTIVWQVGKALSGMSRFVIADDGHLYVTIGTWNDTGSERTMKTLLVWAS